MFLIFSGQMLINWLTSNAIVNDSTLIDRDLIHSITVEFCTNLLRIGVLTQTTDKLTPLQDVFSVSTVRFIVLKLMNLDFGRQSIVNRDEFFGVV